MTDANSDTSSKKQVTATVEPAAPCAVLDKKENRSLWAATIAKTGKTPSPNMMLKIEKYTFHVHTQILSKASPVFARMFSHQFKESKEKCVTLHDDDPRAVARMITWCYLQEYDDIAPLCGYEHDLLDAASKGIKKEDAKEPDSVTQPLVHARVCVIANKYQMDGLLIYCGNKFEGTLKEGIVAIHQGIDDLLEIQVAATVLQLWKLVAKYAAPYLSVLNNTHEGFRTALEINPDFSAELVRRLILEQGKWRYKNEQIRLLIPLSSKPVFVSRLLAILDSD